MTGAEWIAEKINLKFEGQNVAANVENKDVVFIERGDKANVYIAAVPTRRGDTAPIISQEDVEVVLSQNCNVEMMVAIPRAARWSGPAIRWLQSNGIAFGGVGDLYSALGCEEEISAHRNKTFSFVDDSLRLHSCVADLVWIDSKKVQAILINGTKVTIALDESYDITMDVARTAARTLGQFDALLKTNPNGSITSGGADQIERLGFITLKWGDLLGYLAKTGRQTGSRDLKRRVQRA